MFPLKNLARKGLINITLAGCGFSLVIPNNTGIENSLAD